MTCGVSIWFPYGLRKVGRLLKGWWICWADLCRCSSEGCCNKNCLGARKLCFKLKSYLKGGTKFGFSAIPAEGVCCTSFANLMWGNPRLLPGSWCQPSPLCPKLRRKMSKSVEPPSDKWMVSKILQAKFHSCRELARRVYQAFTALSGCHE